MNRPETSTPRSSVEPVDRGLRHARGQPRAAGRWRRIGLPVAGGLLAVLLASELTGWFWLRTPAAWIASRAIDREVTIAAPFRLRLLRADPSMAIGHLRIGAPGWSDEPHFADLAGLAIRTDWATLTGRAATLHDVRLVRGDIRAIRGADGRATWPGGGEPSPGSTGPARVPAVGAIDIGALAIRVADAATDLTLTVGARTKPADDGVAALHAEGRGAWKSQPFAFELTAPRILEIAARGNARALLVDGRIRSTTLRFEGSVTDLIAADGIDGRITAAGDSLGDLSVVPGLVLPDTPPFRLEARLQRDAGHLRGTVERAEIGSSRMTAQFDYAGDQQPPMLRGRLDATRLVLQDLGPAIGGDGKRAGGGDRRILPHRVFDVPGLKAMNADFAIDLRQLDLGTDALRPLTGIRTRLRLEDGRLSLDDLQAALAGGQVSGRTVLDTRDDRGPPVWQADLDWNRVELRRWIRSGATFYVAGRFSGKTRMQGQGKSTSALLESLDGSIRGRIDGGSISHLILEAIGLDVAQAVGVLFRGSRPLEMTCALIDIGATDGKARIDTLVVNTRDTLLFVEGGLDFGDESIAARIVPAPKDWSPFSLRTPIRVGGTLGAPAISLEPSPLALKVLAGIVLGAATPLAALIPFIEPPAGATDEGCGAALQAANRRATSIDADPSVEPESADAQPSPAEGDPPPLPARLRPPGTRP